MTPLRKAAWIALSMLALLAGCNSAMPHATAREVRYHASADGAAEGLATTVSAEGRTRQPFGSIPSASYLFKDSDGDGLPDVRVPDPTAPADRMMVYHGAITLEVARADEAIANFLLQVRQWGGYLSEQQDQTVTVRVPATQFDAAFAALRGMGRVLGESRQAEDITKQYADLGIRLDNARKARERLLALLEKANKVEDVLAIEKELRALTEEIERMEGEQKYLADQAAMSTLQATFRDAGAPQARRAAASRFWWINQVGVQNALEDF